jgi:hypothetical protein
MHNSPTTQRIPADAKRKATRAQASGAQSFETELLIRIASARIFQEFFSPA